MKIFPSYLASAVYGFIGMPLFVYVFSGIEGSFKGQWPVFLWSLVGFFIPVSLVTVDFHYIARQIKEGRSFWVPWARKEDFTVLYFPAWKRMLFLGLIAMVTMIFIGVIKES